MNFFLAMSRLRGDARNTTIWLRPSFTTAASRSQSGERTRYVGTAQSFLGFGLTVFAISSTIVTAAFPQSFFQVQENAA
jgi:hypothetical protein